jgi:hypothetical protein
MMNSTQKQTILRQPRLDEDEEGGDGEESKLDVIAYRLIAYRHSLACRCVAACSVSWRMHSVS